MFCIIGFNDDEICDFIKITQDKYVDIRFIEYMPFSGNKWDYDKMVSYSEMLNIIRKEWPDIEKLNSLPNDTSKVLFENLVINV